MALLVLRRVGLCVGQNQMCHLCGWLKLFLKNVRWEKIKIQKRWLLGRLSVGIIVPLRYVYFCRSFLLCRLLGLQVTVCGLAKVAIFSTNFQRSTKAYMRTKLSYEALNRHFCQTAVTCWRSVCRCSIVHCLRCLWCVGLVALLYFLALICVSAKNANVLPNAMALSCNCVIFFSTFFE